MSDENSNVVSAPPPKQIWHKPVISELDVATETALGNTTPSADIGFGLS